MEKKKTQKAKKAPKTPKPAKAPKASKTGDQEISFSKASLADVKFATRQRVSRFGSVIEAALKLNTGDSLLVPVPAGTDPQEFRGSLSTALGRKVKPVVNSADRKLILRVTTDGKIAVGLVARKAKAPKKAK